VDFIEAQRVVNMLCPARPAVSSGPARIFGQMSTELPPTPDTLDAACRSLGHEGFRPGQREAVETLLEVGRLLLVAPTGGGKSLIYQLPATLLPGTTLVVSPLIALMQDQVAALVERGAAATFLASTLDAGEMRSRVSRLARGELDLVYVAPERLQAPRFRAALDQIDCPLVAVDEAHCISEWGHDFRPEYLQIGDLIASLPHARVLACTATATPVVRDEILARLGLPADTPQLVRGFARPELALRAEEVSGGRDRADRVDGVLAEALGSPGADRGTAIVYSPTRRAAEEETERLSGVGWRAHAYHAGLGADARARAQQAFADGDAEVVVATNAFGMGIDRPDVRAVIHLGPPGSIESYYQEVGRAGRDGQPAIGLLLYTGADLPLRRSLIERDGEGGPADAAVVAHRWGLFLELMRWAEGGSCRHDAILRYFGDEAETLDGCGVCDECLGHERSDVDAEEVSLVVRKALSGVARVSGRFGMGAAVKLLRGEAEPRLERAGLDRVSTFGVLADRSEDWITRLLRRCVVAGWVGFTGGDRPVVLLSDDGRAVMAGQRPARLLLPTERGRPARVAGRRTPGPVQAAEDVLSDSERALFEALRHHRLECARQEGVPPYVVASDRTLREISRLRPRTTEDLLQAHGIGAQKAERYGAGLLQVVERLASAG
jgi:ATP-dependent DNA helicase RecQ